MATRIPKHLACQQPWMKRRSSTINGSKETKTSEKKPQRQWSAQQWATEIDWEQRTKYYKYDMTTETRTDRPQIDTSRMNNDDHAYVTPAPRALRSGHRNDRPSERRDFDQDLQHSRDDPAIVLIGLPWDDINEPDPESENEPDPRVRTSLNPRARTSLTPRSPRTRTSPTSLGTRTRTSPRKREHARTRHLQCLLDDQLQRRFPVSQFLQSRSRSRPTWPNSIHSIDHGYNSMTPDR